MLFQQFCFLHLVLSGIWNYIKSFFEAGHFADTPDGQKLQHAVESKAFDYFAKRVTQTRGDDAMLQQALGSITSGKKWHGESKNSWYRSLQLLSHLGNVFWPGNQPHFLGAVGGLLLQLPFTVALAIIPGPIIRFIEQRFADKISEHLTKKATEIKLDMGLSSRKYDRLRQHLIYDRDPSTGKFRSHEVRCTCCCSSFQACVNLVLDLMHSLRPESPYGFLPAAMSWPASRKCAVALDWFGAH